MERPTAQVEISANTLDNSHDLSIVLRLISHDLKPLPHFRKRKAMGNQLCRLHSFVSQTFQHITPVILRLSKKRGVPGSGHRKLIPENFPVHVSWQTHIGKWIPHQHHPAKGRCALNPQRTGFLPAHTFKKYVRTSPVGLLCQPPGDVLPPTVTVNRFGNPQLLDGLSDRKSVV